jgi:pSer/pThr/pTyr-binding forkhead associated (FHA) protein
VNQLVYEHQGKRHEVKLGSTPVSLGRSAEATHKLPTKAASRIHAQVFLRDGAWWLEDLGSSNGTFLNNRKLSVAASLSDGDTIRVADIKLTFKAAPAALAQPPGQVPRLVYQPEPGKAPVELVLDRRVTIGRKGDNTLQIDTKAISGRHCEVFPQDGKFIVRDLGSSNGTWVGKKRVTEHQLRNGDVLVVGKTATLYFIDPQAKPSERVAATKERPPAPSGKPAAITKPEPPKVDDPDQRGTFEPVKPRKTFQPRQLIQPGLGVGVALLLLVIGWLIGGIAYSMREPDTTDPTRPESEPPLADAAFSFEGDIDDRGNPEGWLASFEAAEGATATLYSDPDHPYDGLRSLRAEVEGSPRGTTLFLQTARPRSIPRSGAYNVSLFVRAEGAPRISAALSLIGERGEVVTLAAGSFVGIRSASWASIEFTGVSIRHPPENAHIRLLISGAFSKLWIDRLELTPVGESTSTTPVAMLTATNLEVSLNETIPVEALVRSTTGHTARFMPVLLGHEDVVLSEPDLWSAYDSDARRTLFSALMPARGEAASLEFTAASAQAEFFTERGFDLRWQVRQGNVESLAMSIELPLPQDATVMIADRRGVPVVVSRNTLHTYPYATITEIMVNDTDLALGFPQGAVVWLDFTRPGVLRITARTGVEVQRDRFRVQVFSRPRMFARMYERLYDEALRMWEADHGSAAYERLRYLTHPSRPHRELEVISRAEHKLSELEAAHSALLREFNATWLVAEGTQSPEAVAQAGTLMQRYLAIWPGRGGIRNLPDRERQLRIWRAELQRRERTPEQLAAAEANANVLYDRADRLHRDGNNLQALMLVENLLRDYSDTSVYRRSLILYEEIAREMQDERIRDSVIDEELAGIDEDIRFRDYDRALRRAQALFRRYPDTPRNREIMQRLRAIERARGAD